MRDMQSSNPPSFGRRIRGWIKWGLILYCALGVIFYFLQDYILFHPARLQKDKKYDFNALHTEINIPFDQESNLAIVEFKTNYALAKGVVLYFHGNKKNVGWYAKYAPRFTAKGYEFWMLDYPGFGKSTGKFTDERLYEYALQLYKLARTRFEPG